MTLFLKWILSLQSFLFKNQYMLTTVFSSVVLGAILFVPIILWAYVFTFLSCDSSSRRVLFAGLFAGGVSVLPILYLGTWMPYVWQTFSKNIFLYFWAVFIGLCAFVSLIACIWWGYNRFVKNILLWRTYIYMLVSIFWVIILFFLWEVILLRPLGTSFLQYSGVGVSLWATVVYYVIVACVEEFSKTLGVFGVSSQERMKQWCTPIIMIALWFAFIENILYVYMALKAHGFSSEILQLWFSRSIFSVMLHVLCSVVMYQSLIHMYNYMNQRTFFYAGWVSILGIIFTSLILHSLYDILLTLGITFIVFVYFVGWYMYVWRSIYHEKVSWNM